MTRHIAMQNGAGAAGEIANMFYITISNGLLKGHRKRMGAAVWEFMWLIDKITGIDETGVGKVLGGRPIKLSEIAKDTDVDVDTVSRNLIRLEEEGYITKTIAPYGIIVRVMKAKKRFGNSTEPKGSTKVRNLNRKNAEPHRENAEPNKTVTIDNTKDTNTPGPQSDPNVPLIIDLFKEVNPSYQRLFAIPPQRRAVERLLATHGFEKLKGMIAYLPKSNATKYAPTITTPVQFEAKLGELIAWSQKQKSIKSSTVAFA